MTSYVVNAASTALDPDPLDPVKVLVGQPKVSSRALLGPHGLDVGIWEHTVGGSADVETDEVFVVISGRATIEVAGSADLEVGPGDIGVLEAGAVTRWQVHEDLRKVYIVRS